MEGGDSMMQQMMATLGLAAPAAAPSADAMAAMGAGPAQQGGGGADAAMAMMQSMMAMMSGAAGGGGGGGGGGWGGGNSAKDALVAKVKAWQKKGEKAKEFWWNYCNMNGSQYYDPNRHDETFLTNFITLAESSGEAMIEAAGGEVKKKEWGDKWSGSNDDPVQKEQFVQKIKDWQRSGNACKEMWYTYATECANGGRINYDPTRHDIASLTKFLEYAMGPEGTAALEEARKKTSMQGFKVSSPKLFVGGLPPNCTEDMVTGYFSQFGNVQEFRMMYSSPGVSKGYGFITFDSVEAAQLVMDNYDAHMIDNKWIDCKPGTESNQKQSKGDDGGKGGWGKGCKGGWGGDDGFGGKGGWGGGCKGGWGGDGGFGGKKGGCCGGKGGWGGGKGWGSSPW